MPKFSVVIPTFNRSEALQRAINSVLNQTFSDLEVIVVDDGSTDDTEELVKGTKDRRLKYYWMQNSGGPATPRNRGIEEASGEWVCLLDSDDFWYPEKLEEVAKLTDRCPELDAVYHGIVNRKKGRRPLKIARGVTPDFYKELLVNGNRCPTSSMSIKRSFIINKGLRFDESSEFRVVEDYDFWMKLANAGANFSFIDKILGEYLLGDENISSDFSKQRMNSLCVLKFHVFEVQSFEENKEKLWRNLRARHYARLAANDLKSGRVLLSINNAARSIALSPKHLYLRFLRTLENRLSTSG
ncbi:glycosyltransferase [Halomonas sp. IOP_31]|uniref:glycosyltransferase n=1 Tax=Halomonas sp. IOP_31 TaxID=2876584 RepID=UPI001E563F48|nr:glycosyltransferase [Halomonas sp. IOP_31]MCD6007023.1 glycosyltransferase [Halomonas sp. IOP_31]